MASFIKQEYDCGNTKLVYKYYASRYNSKNKELHYHIGNNTTSEKQQRENDRQAMKRLNILVNANFKKGDYFITFTFANGKKPNTNDECKIIFKKYLRKLRELYKKRGTELKYIYVFEYEGVRPHFHILFNNEGINLSELPQWEYGTPKIELLDDREYHNIGEYFVKQVAPEENRRRGKIGSSRNLYRPEPKITVLSSPHWSKRPRVQQGYRLIDETLINGYTKYIDSGYMFPYQSYVLVKEE